MCSPVSAEMETKWVRNSASVCLVQQEKMKERPNFVLIFLKKQEMGLTYACQKLLFPETGTQIFSSTALHKHPRKDETKLCTK